MTVPGWRDEDATEPKPTEACSCGATSWSWYRPDQRWVCSRCGALAARRRVDNRRGFREVPR